MTRNRALRCAAWLATIAACLVFPFVDIVYGLAVHFIIPGFEPGIAWPTWDQMPELERYLDLHPGLDTMLLAFPVVVVVLLCVLASRAAVALWGTPKREATR